MNILTIDLEEWYTYELYKKGPPTYYEPILEKYLDDVLALLDNHKVKATFFCLGIIARRQPLVIQKIANNGHEIGCHSDVHKLLTSLTPSLFREDTKKAIDSLSQVIGKKVTMYRAPAFTITERNKWALELLVESGIEIDSSIFPANRSYGGFPALNIKKPTIIKTEAGFLKEFPMNYSPILGKRIIYTGGGYFRILPYAIIKHYFNLTDYNMSYFHLRDFDKFQKKVINTRFFINYVGINSCFSKFEDLLNDFPFISLAEADQRINWDFSKNIMI